MKQFNGNLIELIMELTDYLINLDVPPKHLIMALMSKVGSPNIRCLSITPFRYTSCTMLIPNYLTAPPTSFLSYSSLSGPRLWHPRRLNLCQSPPNTQHF